MQQRAHIRICIIYDMFPAWLRTVSDTISVVLIWAFYVSLTWGSFNEARDKFFRAETFGTAWAGEFFIAAIRARGVLLKSVATANISLTDIFQGFLPFIGVQLLALAILLMFPNIVTVFL